MDGTRWAELLFADDMAAVTRARSGVVHAVEKLFEVTSQWGLTVSVPKRVILHGKGSHEEDVKERIAKASRAFGILRKPIFSNKSLSIHTKRGVYKAIALEKLFEVTSQWGLTASVPKSKMMSVRCEEAQPTLLCGDMQLEVVKSFKYLGSILRGKGSCEEDVKERIAKASRAFGILRKPIFNNKSLSIHTKHGVYKAIVLSLLSCTALRHGQLSALRTRH